MQQTLGDFSVIICAYTLNRWRDLVTAIESVKKQTLLPRETIVVIDYNPALLKQVQEHIPDVHVIENCETKGLRGARNSGVAVAQGKFIAFLDDDAIASADWLQLLNEEFKESTDSQVLGVGGAVIPLWSNNNHSWLPEEFFWVVGCTYRGMPQTGSTIRNPIGANMVIRREVFDSVGDFHSDTISIGAQHAGGCEETELCIRARQHWPKGVFRYQPQASVLHHVSDGRTRWSYFCKRCYAEGVAKAVLSHTVGAKDSLASERTYTLKILPRSVVRYLADALFQWNATALARAVAIVAGLTIVTLGYLVGNILIYATKSSSTDRKSIPALSNQ